MTHSSATARTSPARRGLSWRAAFLAVVLGAAALSVGTAALVPTAAQAANVTVDQCNDRNAGPMGATTGMDCEVTVVNTISGGLTSSTVSVSRLCSLDPCAGGNGTFTTSSSDLVTQVTQCNGSGNDAAHTTTCSVSITNNISADTPGAEPVSAATVNQCVGSAQGGGGANTCGPFPANTTTATVTQCNTSANGGGGTIDCTVATASQISPAIPVRVNQCNGTGNPAGSVVTCDVAITTNITAAVEDDDTSGPVATTAASGNDTGTTDTDTTGTGTPNTGTPDSDLTESDSTTPDTTSSRGDTPQVSLVPSGGIQAGLGASGALPVRTGVVVTGLACLLAALGLSILGHRARHQD